MAIVVPVYITVARDMVLLLQMLCGLANQTRQVDVLIVVDDASLIRLPTFQINAAAQVTPPVPPTCTARKPPRLPPALQSLYFHSAPCET